VELVRALTTLYAFMSNETVVLTECLITHITAKKALTTMYELMIYQTALDTDCLIIHITSIRAFIFFFRN